MSNYAQTLDLTVEDNIITTRQRVLAPLMNDRNYGAAIEVLNDILAAQPERVQERCEVAGCHARIGQMDAAHYHIHKALSFAPDDPKIGAQALQILLQANELEDAVAIAKSFLPDMKGHARLASLATTVFYRANDTINSVIAARLSADLNRDNIGTVAKAAGVLTTAGYASEAIKVLEDADVLLSEDASAYFELGRAEYWVNKTSSPALDHLQKAHELAPENGRIVDLLLRALLSHGKATAAVELVEQTGVSLAKSRSFKLQFARALRGAHRYDEAAEIMLELVRDDPDNTVLRRQCAAALAIAGREDEGMAVHQDDLKSRRARLPERFVQGLAALPARLHEAKIPPQRLEWAYRKLQELGSAPDDRQAWEDRIRWINLADYYILDWIECAPEKGEELLTLIDGIPEATQKVTDRLDPGQGGFMVTCHIGALFAGPAALVASGLDPLWVASTPVIKDGPGAGRILSTSSMDELALARAILNEVNNGRLVSIAIDGAGVPNLPRRALFDKQIGLSDFVPRTVYKTGIPSFVPICLWKGDRIHTDIIPLPLPQEGEARKAFVERWFEAFLNEIVTIFREYPENLRLSGGFWSGITI